MIPQRHEQLSGYPQDGIAANVSKETTSKEILEIGSIDKELFKTENMNILYGPVNAVSYCINMFNFPELDQLKLL